MWPNFVVVSSPSLAFSYGVVEAHGPVLVQALRPQLAVEPKAGEANLSMNALSVGLPGRLKSSVTLRFRPIDRDVHP
jgi:hypothetical protein